MSVAHIDRNSIRIRELGSNTVLQIMGNYHAAYSRTRLDENERVRLTFQDVILPTLKLVVAVFNADPQIQGYFVEGSHYFRARCWAFPGKRRKTLPWSCRGVPPRDSWKPGIQKNRGRSSNRVNFSSTPNHLR